MEAFIQHARTAHKGGDVEESSLGVELLLGEGVELVHGGGGIRDLAAEALLPLLVRGLGFERSHVRRHLLAVLLLPLLLLLRELNLALEQLNILGIGLMMIEPVQLLRLTLNGERAIWH